MDQEPNWIEQEQKEIPAPVEFIRLPALKLEENKVTEIKIDFSNPFEKWADPETHKKKAIIPCISEGINMNWWLNVQNPVYREILAQGKAGVTNFKILQIGTQNKTRYILVMAQRTIKLYNNHETQRNKILELFRLKGFAYTSELVGLGIYQYNARIKELRTMGYNIVSKIYNGKYSFELDTYVSYASYGGTGNQK